MKEQPDGETPPVPVVKREGSNPLINPEIENPGDHDHYLSSPLIQVEDFIYLPLCRWIINENNQIVRHVSNQLLSALYPGSTIMSPIMNSNFFVGNSVTPSTIAQELHKWNSDYLLEKGLAIHVIPSDLLHPDQELAWLNKFKLKKPWQVDDERSRALVICLAKNVEKSVREDISKGPICASYVYAFPMRVVDDTKFRAALEFRTLPAYQNFGFVKLVTNILFLLAKKGWEMKPDVFGTKSAEIMGFEAGSGNPLTAWLLLGNKWKVRANEASKKVEELQTFRRSGQGGKAEFIKASLEHFEKVRGSKSDSTLRENGREIDYYDIPDEETLFFERDVKDYTSQQLTEGIEEVLEATKGKEIPAKNGISSDLILFRVVEI